MAVLRAVRAVGAIGLLVLLLALEVPASADRRTVRDDTQSFDEGRDMASVAHGHGPSDRIVRHEIRFDGNPDSVAGNVSLFFRFRTRSGEVVRRELAIRRNPGGGLYGAFLTRRHEVTGYARAWVEDATLVVEFSVPALGRAANDRYRWYAWTFLGAGEFEDPCSGEDRGPPVCKDRAPASGAIVHRL